jgi:hypothetical protein
MKNFTTLLFLFSFSVLAGPITEIEQKLGVHIHIDKTKLDRSQQIQGLKSLKKINKNFETCVKTIRIYENYDSLDLFDGVAVSYLMTPQEMEDHISKNCVEGESIDEMHDRMEKVTGLDFHALPLTPPGMTREQYFQGLKTLSTIPNLRVCADRINMDFENRNGGYNIDSPDFDYEISVKYDLTALEMEAYIKQQCKDEDIAFENLVF